MPSHRFPPPWSVEELDACFVVRDHGQANRFYYVRAHKCRPVPSDLRAIGNEPQRGLMGNFDGRVGKIIDTIKADLTRKKNDADAAANAADIMFGRIGQLIQELQPKLAEQFPDLAPEVSLGTWVRRKDASITNKLSLKRKGVEKSFDLIAGVSAGAVRIEKQTIPSDEALLAIVHEIVRFFIAD